MRQKFINHYNNIQFFLLLVLAAFPILPKGIQSTVIVLMSVSTTIYFFIEGKKHWSYKKIKVLVVLGSLPIINSVSLLYSENLQLGFKYIFRLSPMILIVLVFLIGKVSILSTERLYKLFVIFIISLILLLSFLHINFLDEIYTNDISPWELRSYMEEFINIHGTYLSMWIGMGILILIWLLCKSSRKTLMRIAGGLFLLYFYYWLYVIGARMPFFATLISSMFLFLFLLRTPLKIIVISFLILGIAGCIVFKPQIYSKIEELSDYKNAIPAGKYENTNPLISNENIRSVIYYCSFKIFVEEPLFGYGTGSVNKQLQGCYDEDFNHTDLFKRFQFNSHSQYLQVILSSGLIGFLFYIISLMVLVKWSFSRVKLYVGFLLLIFLCFTFENILYRHDGIIFFSFFNSVLFFTRNKDNQ